MISKFTRTVLLATAVIIAVPATFASAQAAPYDNHGRRETLQHRQHAACGHIHSRHARNSCEARVAHDWQRDRHHH